MNVNPEQSTKIPFVVVPAGADIELSTIQTHSEQPKEVAGIYSYIQVERKPSAVVCELSF